MGSAAAAAAAAEVESATAGPTPAPVRLDLRIGRIGGQSIEEAVDEKDVNDDVREGLDVVRAHVSPFRTGWASCPLSFRNGWTGGRSIEAIDENEVNDARDGIDVTDSLFPFRSLGVVSL